MANADTQPVIADAPPAAVQVLRMLWRDKFALCAALFLIVVILFIQRRPRGLFALKGQAEEA